MPSKLTPVSIPHLNLDDPLWRLYVEFLEERSQIWHRKEVLKLSAPWTVDPILQRAYFCNIYRELDKNTRFELKLLEEAKGDPEEQFLRILLYRNTNSVAMYNALKRPLKFGPEEWPQVFQSIKSAGQGISRAFRYRTNAGWTHVTWSWRCAEQAHELHKSILAEILQQPTAEAVGDVLMNRLVGVGFFNAYEIYTSLTYLDWFPWSENDWVNVGPGCRSGLEALYNLHRKEVHPYHMSGWLRTLIPHVIQRLKDRGKFVFIPEEFQPSRKEPERFTLRTFEHSICEFRKYYQIRWRGMWMRRQYVRDPLPAEWPSNGPIGSWYEAPVEKRRVKC